MRSLLIRRFLYLHPVLFKSVRDLGLVSPIVQTGPERQKVVHSCSSQALTLDGLLSGRAHPQLACLLVKLSDDRPHLEGDGPRPSGAGSRLSLGI